MSLNKLVGGDCGGNNALVQLSNIVRRDASLPQAQLSQSDRFVQEFMGHNSQNPQTFNMNTLLNNLPANVSAPQGSTSTNSMPMHVAESGAHVNRPWSGVPSTSYFPQQQMMPGMFRQQQPLLHNYQKPNVQIEYVSEAELAGTSADVKAKAAEYVESVKEDDELAYNQFMSFMQKISAGELNLGESADGNQRTMSAEQQLNEMSEKYKEEWDKLSNVENYWDTEAMNGIPAEYSFTEGNVMLENKSALELGKEKLKMGDVPGAVMCFEAAAQQQPNSAEAWFLLGTTLAENEQDPMAIIALKKSLEINPTQLEAYITLAAAYTNENMSKFAFSTLIDWLRASPKYADLLPQDVDPKNLHIKDLENYVKSLYMKAVQMNPTQIDPDIQNALGVVFNLSQEYGYAADCFKTALTVSMDNAKLWNRLGATLANSEKSEEAVSAYHEALNLEPGFIRARYNVGITCMNLGAHRQAAEHFLVALNQQHKAKGMFPDSANIDTSSSTIWTTLRMVCSFMGEHDVAKLVDERNLEALNKFFEI